MWAAGTFAVLVGRCASDRRCLHQQRLPNRSVLRRQTGAYGKSPATQWSGTYRDRSKQCKLVPVRHLRSDDQAFEYAGIQFPYLKDENGAVARSYGTVCTPHAFVPDSHHCIVYRRRIDDSRMGKSIASCDLANAVVDVVAGRPVTAGETEPFGCSIVC